MVEKHLVAGLGSVTPWIVVPGEWSDRDLRFEAEDLAGLPSTTRGRCFQLKGVWG